MHHRWEPHVSVHPNEVHVLFEPSFSLADNRRAVGLLLQGDVYIAAIYFSNETRQVLLERFPPKHAHVIAEHMTLAFRPSREFVESLPLGQHVHLRVVEERYDAKGHCVKLEWVDNAVPVDSIGQRILHATMSFAPDSAAYYSNALLLDESATIVPLQPVDQFEISGQVGVALQTPHGPKWKKPLLLDMPACTWAASTCRHVVIVVDIAAIRDKTAIVSELEWVAGPGAVLVLVTSDASDFVFYSQRQIEFHHVLLSAASVATTYVDLGVCMIGY
ncbi:hypothetical protein DYB32_009835 [Aphanomyces invadans]|uniref:Uncharacterized protein n=1 Tax=Aphanomyces invadans TaxID=157072 RepID=A0A3R6YX74_9STRA|nr:hypothetical protein DYB32_009835 [Aphanomyces invadans]